MATVRQPQTDMPGIPVGDYYPEIHRVNELPQVPLLPFFVCGNSFPLQSFILRRPCNLLCSSRCLVFLYPFFFCFLFGYFLVPVISLNKQVNSSIGLPGTLPQKQYTWVHWLQDIFEQGEASSVLTWYIVHVARCERSTLCTGSLSMSAAFIES